MQYVIYFLLAIFATTVGSLTGMGGGIIIKPLMDVLGDYDIQTIGIVSSITVFAMAVVSVIKQIRAKAEISYKTVLPLSIGSVTGGFFGESLLKLIIKALDTDNGVIVIQNVVLAILILCVIIYMKNKSRIKGRLLEGIFISLAVGVFLGFFSSFLGIGGGPINVAIMIFLFSFTTKTATVCSLISILFAQISKLVTVGVTTGFSSFDLSIAPVMIIGAIMGGFIGAAINKKCKDETVEKAFNGVQIFVLLIAVFNIVRNLI